MAACMLVKPESDLRDRIFAGVFDEVLTVAITAQNGGILAGIDKVGDKAEELGLTVLYRAAEGALVTAGEKVFLARGNPKQVAISEEMLMGLIAKTSGIATAARKAVDLAKGKADIVSGSWKKMPPELKFMVREAVSTGGAHFRIANPPFVYLDKNYVRVFGGVRQTLEAVSDLEGMTKAIQIRGETASIAEEATEAVRGGADILMVDTGRPDDVDLVSSRLLATGLREQVKIAFAGGVKIKDIPLLLEKDIDILDIGLEIVDAPLLDFRMDIVEVRREGNKEANLAELNLLEKTEIWLDDIYITGVDLNDIASVVANSLNLRSQEVLVVDVRETHITLDILRRVVQARDIAGKEREVLERLALIPGIKLGEGCRIHSEGVLGLIALPPEEIKEALSRSSKMVEEIKSRVARRVKVFPSGFEVKKGMIIDTNSPMIADEFGSKGYKVVIGDVLDDNVQSIALRLSQAVEEGYGLIITTGGVGAEDKDCTVEGILRLDPMAATSWIVKYQKGTGRHQKEGVRVAVGEVGQSFIIALPGPNDEVRVSLKTILEELSYGAGKTVLAEKIACALREVLRAKSHDQGVHQLYHHS